MHDHKLEVEKKGEIPVNTKKVKKNVTRKAKKLKPVKRFDPATERMGFRVTPAEKFHLQQLAIEAGQTDSKYIRELLITHLKENPLPPE